MIIITTTNDDKVELERIAKSLIDQRLAACCQIVGPITSVYRWQESIEETTEWMCLIKTKSEQFERIESVIKQLHHYETPEIVATEVSAGSADTLRWIDETVE